MRRAYTKMSINKNNNLQPASHHRVCVAQCKVNRQRKNCFVTRKRVCVVFFFCMTVFVSTSIVCRMNWLRTRWKRKNVSERNLMCTLSSHPSWWRGKTIPWLHTAKYFVYWARRAIYTTSTVVSSKLSRVHDQSQIF